MCDAPIETTSWSPAEKWNASKKLMKRVGRGGIVTSKRAEIIKIGWTTQRLMWELEAYIIRYIFYFLMIPAFLIFISS